MSDEHLSDRTVALTDVGDHIVVDGKVATVRYIDRWCEGPPHFGPVRTGCCKVAVRTDRRLPDGSHCVTGGALDPIVTTGR